MNLPVCLLILFLLLTDPSSRAQGEAPVDLRVHNGRLEMVFTGGIPAGERLTVVTSAGRQTLPLSEGGGLVLVPLDFPASALAASLQSGRATAFTLTGPTLTARWLVAPVPWPSLPLPSAAASDSQSTGSLAPEAGALHARLNLAGTSNNYISFLVDQALPADATAIGAAYQLAPGNTMGVLLAYRLTDSRNEVYGAFLPADDEHAIELTSRPIHEFDYKYGGPPDADRAALPASPLRLNSVLFETADHRRKGATEATVFGVFVIRRIQFSQTPASPRPSVITVDFGRRTPGIPSMSGFLHGSDAVTPSDAQLMPLHPALWRMGVQWLTLRDRLARLQIPTIYILTDNWARKIPDGTDDWKNYVRDMVRKANGYTFTWDVLNEPNFSSSWPGTPDQFAEVFVQASQVLHQTLGPGVLVSGPSVSHYDRAYLTHFLDYCKAHNARVDVLSWHELDSDTDIPAVEDHLVEARRLFVDNPAYQSLGIRKIDINEIVGPSAQYRPGEILGYLDALERGGASGACKGCWADSKGGSNCGNNTLDGILTPDTHLPRAAWWAYKAYADTVPARVLSRSSDRSLVAFASAGTRRECSVLVGGFTYGGYQRTSVPLVIHLQNLQNLPFLGSSRRVHVKVEKIPDTGEQALNTLPVVQEREADIVRGAAQFPLPPLAPHEAYRLTLSQSLEKPTALPDHASGTAATASISTMTSSGRRATSMVDRAGLTPVKYAP